MKAGVPLLFGLLLGLFARDGAAASAVTRYAIVIGNNRPAPGGSSTPLRYADDDAAATHALLLDAGVHSVLLTRLDADSARLQRADPTLRAPTVAALHLAFAAQVARMQAEARRGSASEFLFFFSGHGDVADGEGFVVLEDGRLTRSGLFELLSRSPATVNHVFIDACKSYYLVFDRGAGGSRAPYTGAPPPLMVPGRLDNTGFVLSTSSDRDSHEWERYQGGILSHELRSALRGAADTNLDGSLSYAELGAFLGKANQAIENPVFRPDFMVRPPQNQLERPILSWPRGDAALRVGRVYLGPFYVETERGERLLDAHAAPGQELALRLPSRRPLFVRRKDGLGEALITTTDVQEVSALLPSTPAIASRGALNVALEELFAAPFADADVHEFARRSAARAAARGPDAVDPHASSALRWGSGVAAVTAAAVGLTAHGVALGTSLDGADESQTRRTILNRRIVTLDRLALASYGGALLAGAIWAATWWSEAPVAVVPEMDPTRAQLGLAIDGSF
jgi:hypothetical protein